MTQKTPNSYHFAKYNHAWRHVESFLFSIRLVQVLLQNQMAEYSSSNKIMIHRSLCLKSKELSENIQNQKWWLKSVKPGVLHAQLFLLLFLIP